MKVKIDNVRIALKDDNELLFHLNDIFNLFFIHSISGYSRKELRYAIIDKFKSICEFETYDNGWRCYEYITQEQLNFLLEIIKEKK